MRAALVVLVIVAAMWSSSCTSEGVGMGMGYTGRWGAGMTGPPVFVGGPVN